ncbi:SPOSA6832_04245, partial [Sporobolomyces salmonicolor]
MKQRKRSGARRRATARTGSPRPRRPISSRGHAEPDVVRQRFRGRGPIHLRCSLCAWSGAIRAPITGQANPSRRTRPPVNRLKSAASSRAQSPLSGVKLPPPPSASSASPRPSASPSKYGKQREPSVSPPPYARAAPISTAAVAAARVEDERAEQGAGAASPVPVAGVNLDALAEFGIPPLPTGPCNPSVEAKLANFHALRQTRGLHFNDSLHASKAFRNPRIYAKLVDFVDVDETETNWSKDMWDPKGLGPDATASRIGARSTFSLPPPLLLPTDSSLADPPWFPTRQPNCRRSAPKRKRLVNSRALAPRSPSPPVETAAAAPQSTANGTSGTGIAATESGNARRTAAGSGVDGTRARGTGAGVLGDAS